MNSETALSIGISYNFNAEDIQPKPLELSYPVDYSSLNEKQQDKIIKSHNYQTCVYHLSINADGYSITNLSNEINETCNKIVTQQGT